MSYGLIFALVCAVTAIVFGAIWINQILAKPAGNPRMQEIAAAIQAGAKAYLNRQYRTIAIVGVILFIVILIFGANKLPQLGRGVGSAIKNFKDGMKDE